MNYIREAGRVLKSGGYFYIQVNNLPELLRARLKLRTRLRTLAKILKNRGNIDHPRHGVGPRDLDQPAWQGSRISLSRVMHVCAESSMKVVKTEGEGTQYLWVKAIKQ